MNELASSNYHIKNNLQLQFMSHSNTLREAIEDFLRKNGLFNTFD